MNDITKSQLAQVHIVARHKWPFPARLAAMQHNNLRHAGEPTCCIDPEPGEWKPRPPRYCVWCPVCEVKPDAPLFPHSTPQGRRNAEAQEWQRKLEAWNGR